MLAGDEVCALVEGCLDMVEGEQVGYCEGGANVGGWRMWWDGREMFVKRRGGSCNVRLHDVLDTM